MGKLSRSSQDPQYFDSGLLPMQWHRLFLVSEIPHYMESLEHGSSSSLSDMERQDYENQISGLKETIRTLQSMIKTLQLTIESLNASNSRNEKQIQGLTSEISTLRKIIADLTDCDRCHNKTLN